jgi:pimeloyl-ACP methyl ester carboxylesterase
LADRLERDGVDPFLEDWLAQPLFRGLTDAMQFRDERRENTVVGLAESLRQAGTGSQDPLWPRLHEIDAPVLVVAGALDEKFSAEASRLAASIGPNATMHLVAGTGHAAHLEDPDAFTAALRAWLSANQL